MGGLIFYLYCLLSMFAEKHANYSLIQYKCNNFIYFGIFNKINQCAMQSVYSMLRKHKTQLAGVETYCLFACLFEAKLQMERKLDLLGRSAA